MLFIIINKNLNHEYNILFIQKIMTIILKFWNLNIIKFLFQREEEKLRQSMRKETKVKRARERGANSNLSSSYLEPEREDGSDDENAISLSAIKNKFNKKSASKSKLCH